MMLSGNLSDWSVGDLLQMLHVTKKTASLHVDGSDRSGVVYFEEGAIVNAIVSLGGGPDGDPRDEVVEAVYVLELLDGGTFEIKNEVPPRMIEPLAVAEALEMVGEHLDAERQLDATGLLSARGLRLAPTITEPIILSEQVWNAISVSIPAFTFPELESRLGRAAAVATVEQFRDLGILEAVLDEVEPTAPEPMSPEPMSPEPMSPASDGLARFEYVSEEEADSQLREAYAGSWLPPEPEEAEAFAGSWMAPDPVDGAAVAFVADDEVPFEHHEMSVPHEQEPIPPEQQPIPHEQEPIPHEQEIALHHTEEVRPIVSDAPDDSIVVPDDEDSIVVPDDEPVPSEPEPVAPGLTPGVSSLSAAIRAAAGASTPGKSDDESRLLSEAAGDPADADWDTAGSALPSSDEGSIRRTVKSLVSQPETPLAGGRLGDLGSRFRQATAADQED